MAVPLASPSPCAPWPSPAEKSAPSTGIGRKSVVPATSSLQSMFPPWRRGGIVECTPRPTGGMPITPRNGRDSTTCPVEARHRSPSSVQSMLCGASVSVTPHGPGVTSSTCTASVWPSRAPRTSTGPASGCPSSSGEERGSKYERSSSCQPAFGVAKRTESPGSTVRTGGSSREKWPCSVRRSCGSSWITLFRPAASSLRRHCAYRCADPLDRGQVCILDRPVRVRHVITGDAKHGSLQIEDRALGDQRGELGAEARSPRRLVHDHDTTGLGNAGEDSVLLERPQRAGV